MVEKLNYGNHGVLTLTNTKVLRKKNTNKERKDSNIEVWPSSLQCPSLTFGGDVRCQGIALCGTTSIIYFRLLNLLFKRPFISKP
jgi:hypothetical protein